MIASSFHRASALSSVALWMAKANDSNAENVFNEARQMLLEKSSESSFVRIWVRVAGLASQRTNNERTEGIVQEAMRFIDLLTSRSERIEYLLELAIALGDIKNPTVQTLLEEAKRLVSTFESKNDRNRMLHNITVALFTLSRVEDAIALSQKMSASDQTGLLIRLSNLALKQEKRDLAQDLFERCWPLLEELVNNVEYATTLSTMASYLSRISDPRSKDLFREAFSALNEIEDGWEWAEVNSIVISELIRAGYEEMARNHMQDSPVIVEMESFIQTTQNEVLLEKGLYDQALMEAERMADDQGRYSILCKIAEQLAVAGYTCQAFSILAILPHAFVGKSPLDVLLEQLTDWLLKLTNIPIEVRLSAIENALQVASWVQPRWQPLLNALSSTEASQ
jgi:hypothetical protein